MRLSYLSIPLGVLLAGYLAFALGVYLYQAHLVFRPHHHGRSVRATPEAFGLDYRPVTLSASDGVRLAGWFVPASEPRAVVGFFHGTTGNISHRLGILRFLHDLGLAVLIVDYRGYGRSQGQPSEAGLYRDGEALWQYLVKERSVPPERVVLFGRSLGSAVAARVAARHQPGGLILESPFRSIPLLGQQLLPFLPVQWLARYRFPTQAYTARCRCPLLVIHGTEDRVVPIEHGRAIFEAASGPKRFLAIEGGGHDDPGFVTNESRYRRRLGAFLAKHGPPSQEEATELARP